MFAASTGCTTTKLVQAGPNADGEPEGTGTRRESQPCAKGKTTFPIDAFDINPDETSGKACDVANVLDDDGSFAAIDAPSTATHKLAGRDVTGCLAAEFSEGVTLSSLTMKMRPVGQGCGHACTPGEDGCGTGWKLSLFAGPSLSKLDFVQELSLTTKDFFEYRVAVYERFKARFVAICRQPTPPTGDDVAIDSLYGFCN